MGLSIPREVVVAAALLKGTEKTSKDVGFLQLEEWYLGPCHSGVLLYRTRCTRV